MIAVENPPKLVRLRKHGPKVKTGCKTCKVRRVKCDESKPNCYRCTSTGRRCDGYAPMSEGFQIQVWVGYQGSTLRGATVPLLTGFGDGVRSLEFYHRCARPALASNFDEEFWSRIALQMAHCEPAVRHALIALGSLCEVEPGSMKHAYAGLAAGKEHKTVLTHYNKAVRSLVQRVQEPTYSPEIGLVTCLLFVCIEFLRGNHDTAFMHMRNGLSIISERRQKQRSDSLSPQGSSKSGSNVTKSTGDRDYRVLQEARTQTPSRFVERDFGVPAHPVTFREMPRRIGYQDSVIEDKLAPIFVRAVSSAIMYGVDAEENLDIPSPYPSLLSLPSFSSLREAEEAYYELRNSCIIHIGNGARRMFCKEPVCAGDLQEQSNLLACHDSWKEKVDHLLLRSRPSSDEELAVHCLWTSFYTTYIYICCSMWTDEMQFDKHLEMFKKINYHSEFWINARCQNKTQGAPHFTFEISVVPALFFVALRCRCPNTRREAVALLQRDPPREGLWDPKQQVLVANRVIEMEEKLVDQATGWPLHGTRVLSSTINAGMDRDGGFWASFIPVNLLAVTGPSGGQKLIQQFFRVEE